MYIIESTPLNFKTLIFTLIQKRNNDINNKVYTRIYKYYKL